VFRFFPIFQPPKALSGLKPGTGVISDVFHLLMFGQYGEHIVIDSQCLEERSSGSDFYLEAWNMGSSDMDYALPVVTPFDTWFASHFAEEEIDVFYIPVAGGFKDTIGHAPPCVLESEFHLDSKGR
jgi:hypothetical protein